MKGNNVVEEANLRLVQKPPKVAYNGRRQHHRNQDDCRPKGMATEFPVNQIGKGEPDQRLQQDRPEDEMRRCLHRLPNIWIVQYPAVIAQANTFDGSIWPVCPEVRE